MTWTVQRDDYRMGILFSNGSGATVPAFGIIQQDSSSIVDGNFVIGGVKPSIDNTASPVRNFFVNRASDTADEAKGVCTPAMDEPTLALCNTTTVGKVVGPSDADWTLRTGHPGFVVQGAGPISDTAFVMRKPGAVIVKGAVQGNFATSDSTFTINTVVTMSGLEAVANATQTVTVQNLYKDEGDSSGQKASAIWNEDDEQWEAMDITCPS